MIKAARNMQDKDKQAEDYMAEARSEKGFRKILGIILIIVIITGIAITGVLFDYW